ncbi:MAG: hypothetical protein ACKVOO_11465 [Burkholderiaceae bacterium]
MRTTLAIDDDVFVYVRHHAQQERISIGEAMSRLARRGIQAQGSYVEPAAKLKFKSAFSLMPVRGEMISTEHVRALLDQDGL